MIWKIQHFSEQTQYFNWNTSVNMNAYGILWAFTDSIAINHRGHSKLKKSFKQTVFIFYTLYHPTPDTILLLYQNPEPYALIIVNILFTSSPDFLINFLATSSQIAGTVTPNGYLHLVVVGHDLWNFETGDLSKTLFHHWIPELLAILYLCNLESLYFHLSSVINIKTKGKSQKDKRWLLRKVKIERISLHLSK